VGDEFWFTVLGPVRAWRDSAEVMLGTVQQRATLAVLLLNGNTHVSVDESVGGGYLVRVNASTLDLAAFTQARTDADNARRDRDPETAATRLREALALWQGQPLADIQGPYAERQRETSRACVRRPWSLDSRQRSSWAPRARLRHGCRASPRAGRVLVPPLLRG
jgi:hypothetical protein